MIQEIRDLQTRLAALERSLQRPTQEIRDNGDLRLRWGRQPDGAWTVRAYDAAGNQVGDLIVTPPAWGALALANGWTNAAGVYPVAAASITGDGIIRLRGLIVAGTTASNTVLTTVPSGAEPGYRHIYWVWPGGHRIDVLADGTVVLVTYAGTGFASLDQISWQVGE